MQKYIELLDQTELNILQEMIQNGELKEYQKLYSILEQAKEKIIKLKDYNVVDVINCLSKEYIEQARQFVDEQKCPGISTGIQNYKGPEINVYYGKTSGLENAKEIDETVRFDSASVTKMYTALQYIYRSYFLQYKHSLDNVKISEINPEFQQKTTLRELLTFYHIFQTDGKLELVCSNEGEAISLLKNAKIMKSHTFYYSDIPYMIASLLEPDFKTYFKEIFEKLIGLNQTGYVVKPDDVITGGSMNELNLVHDSKARILPYAGHAGIYTTSHDSLKLFNWFCEIQDSYFFYSNLATPYFSNSNHLFSRFVPDGFVPDGTGKMCYQTTIQEINGEKVIRYEPIWVKKAMGVYCKHPLGLDKTDVLPYQGKYAFAADGFTGCWCNYDIENQMSANIFTNPLSGSEDGKKPQGYIWMLDGLKEKSIETLIELKYAQIVFETYYGASKDFQKRYIK